MKKFVLITLSILLIFSISACEKETKDTNAPLSNSEETTIPEMVVVEEAGMKNVFSSVVTNMEFKLKFMNGLKFYFTNMFYMDGRVYIASDKFKKVGDNDLIPRSRRENEFHGGYHMHCHLLSFDINGENEELRQITQVNPDPECDICFMWYDSEYNQITIEDFKFEYTLHKRTFDDEIIFSMSLKDIFGEEVIETMVIGDDDNIYIANQSRLCIISKDGEVLKNISSTGLNIAEISSAHGKKPIFKTIRSRGLVYEYFDWETDTFTPIEMPVADGMFDPIENHIYYGEGYDYYTYTDAGIYGYDIATNTLTKVLDWMNSDITLSETFSFLPITPKKMARLYQSGSGYNDLYSIMNKVPDDEIPEKTYLSIGYISPTTDRFLMRAVSDFNANNDFFRITLMNYYSSEAGDNYALRLNAAIAAGNAPDLLFVNSMMPLLSYSNKDMLVDMNEFLNEYEGLRDNLIPLAKNATIKGKLTHMITGFRLNTLMAKTANVKVNDNGGWTFGDMLEMYKSGKTITHDLSSAYFFPKIIDKIIADCVDYSTASCDFNQQGFKDFVELMKLVPYSYDYTKEYENYEQFQKERYEAHRKNEILVADAFIYTVHDYVNHKINNFRDEDVTILGYPTINGDNRSEYINSIGLSILNSSENKDVAWQFIMYCLSDHIANYSIDNGYLTPTSSGIDMCNKQYNVMTDTYYDDFTYQGKDYSQFVDGVDGIHVTYNEWFDEFNAYVKNIEDYSPVDYEVQKIIYEELQDYFGTDKSVDDVVNVIQSRVSVYLSEMWG